MASLFGARGGATTGRASDAAIIEWWEPDCPYLTDGVVLYRYVGAFVSGISQIVAVEDCKSLKVLLFDLDELRALRLRDVKHDPPE